MHYPTPRMIGDEARRHAASSLAPYSPAAQTDDSRRFEPYRRMHRLLRGRYHWVIPLVLIAAAAGAFHGWHSQSPLYRSEGLIHVANSLPQVMNSTDQNEPMQMFDEFVESQVLLMGSQHVVALALEDPDFKASLGNKPPLGLEAFATALTIEHPPRTQAIHVTFTWPDPNVAAHAVKAVIGSFLESYGASDGAEEDHRLEILIDRKSAITEQIASLKSSISAIKAPSATSIAMVDDLMRDLLKQESALQAQVFAYDAAGWGDSRPAVVSTRNRYLQTEKAIDSYREEVRTMQVATACSAQQDRRVPLLAEFLPYARQMADLLAQLDETDRRIDVLHTEASLGAGRFRVLSNGELPSVPYADRRARMAAIDGAAAACVPLGLFFLLGLFDRRFRFSEDAQVEATVPLLGVLPSLPEGPLYPELARIAAFCVHNLRIRLQLLNTQERSCVYMITSAAAGEGKTSLTLSVGLSFASAGKRVLLIDCDPIGRGLSQRLKCNTLPGLSEYLNGANLDIATKVSQNLTFLPAGTRRRSPIETEFSGDRLRTLLSEARSRFDVILVDTGPVLSSLQNPVIAQFTDFVILTIAQGQQQPLVERSQRMLQSVGIPVSGFVFNRASASDYRRWVGGTSYYDSVVARNRTRKALSKPKPEELFGPLANSVAADHLSTLHGTEQ
jgi:Mrp family chromosome partitioning ATPase